MDQGVTCEHLDRLAEVLEKELWQSKEALTCFDCGCPGPNLWICLQPDCHHIGCSEVNNDHSTIHQKNYPTHCVHMNISTERIWCYLCEKEVHAKAALALLRMSPDSTSSQTMLVGALGYDATTLNPTLADEGNLEEAQCQETERPRGLVGLQNMGNTCYMNSALQALSNTVPLTNYFLDCAAVVGVLSADKKPGLSRSYQKLMKEMWNNKTRGYVVPNGILYGIRNVHPMFRGYHQHDTQEFLRCFMDQLHEELKEPVQDSTQDNLYSEADGDHRENTNSHMRRRAASSGASDAPFFARMRRKSPASSVKSEPRADGYLRVHTQSESATDRNVKQHRRSASYAGVNYNGAEYSCRDIGSESSLSCGSEPDERYETCSSGASDSPHSSSVRLNARHNDKESSCSGGGGDGSGVRYRSVISEVFDGKLLSSVQCLICNRVSTRVETFQDLSLPIPSREHLQVLRAQQPIVLPHAHAHPTHAQDSWVWWLLGWLRSWFYGPVVSLQDCLAAFFSADELKGDNMYSCSRCKKLRNGVKTSGVMRLPEVLCVHLKRFRHELMFSSKVGAKVAFPLHDLNMAPYAHRECTSKVSRYELSAVICHAGTAGAGHYTCLARNSSSRAWYEFDDQCVTQLAPQAVAAAEAYVLFYRKVNPQMTTLRQKANEILESFGFEANDMRFYISKQWINKFNTWAEPGPIDNGDFVCSHGGVRPDRAAHLHNMASCITQRLWEFFYNNFGGGPACTHVAECAVCARAAERLRARRDAELTTFYHLHASFQDQREPVSVYAISMHWFRQWQAFVRDKAQRPPPTLDNNGIVTTLEKDGKTVYTLKQGSDHAQLSEELWRFFTGIYGGGPEVLLRSYKPQEPEPEPQRTQEPELAKSTSESDVPSHHQTHRQPLQNRRKQSGESVHYKPEQNGTYDSDDDMDHVHMNTESHVHMNGFDHDHEQCSVELLNIDSMSIKTKPKVGSKMRRSKRRGVKDFQLRSG